MVQFATGSFVRTVNTDTTQAYTGVGFQPKALILFGNAISGNEESFFGNIDWEFGFSDGTNDRAFSVFVEDFTSPTDTATRTSTTDIYCIGSGATIRTGTITSFDSDGFTIDWTNNSGSDLQLHYIAIGGSDVTGIKVGQFTAPSVTGDFAVTGVGFEPELVMFMYPGNTSDDSDDADRCNFCIGYFNSAGEQAGTRFSVIDNLATSDSARQQRVTTSCLSGGDFTTATTAVHIANFVSMDSDGFTLNFTTASVADRRVFYMALGGTFTSKIGLFTAPTTGTPPFEVSYTGTGFEPRGVIFQSMGFTNTSTAQNDAKMSFGAADGTNQGLIWQDAGDGDANIATAQIQESDNVFRTGTAAASAASTTTSTLADFVSLDSDGFTLNYTVRTAATATQIIYVALGDGDVVEDTGKRNSSLTNLIKNKLLSGTTRRRGKSTQL